MSRRVVRGVVAVVLTASAWVAAGYAGVADGHSCAKVEQVSPPSTVAGDCSPHDFPTHTCAVNPVPDANLVVTTCTDVAGAP